MDSQDSSSSLQRNMYTDESDNENNNDTSSITNTTTNTKKKRNKSKTSFVWKYFDVIGDKDVCKVIVKKKCEDKKCGSEYIYNGSTSNMIAHLRSSHNIVDSKKLKSETQIPK
ncbi:6800_t:CDS:1, partial [Racocetra fulgida]